MHPQLQRATCSTKSRATGTRRRRLPFVVPEHDIQTAIRKVLARLPDLILWRNNTGATRVQNRIIRFGLCVGSSDLVGILAPAGRLVALEVKSSAGRTTPAQEVFLALVRKHGGFAAVVRSVPEALAAIDRARRGASS